MFSFFCLLDNINRSLFIFILESMCFTLYWYVQRETTIKQAIVVVTTDKGRASVYTLFNCQRSFLLLGGRPPNPLKRFTGKGRPDGSVSTREGTVQAQRETTTKQAIVAVTTDKGIRACGEPCAIAEVSRR